MDLQPTGEPPWPIDREEDPSSDPSTSTDKNDAHVPNPPRPQSKTIYRDVLDLTIVVQNGYAHATPSSDIIATLRYLRVIDP